MALNLYGLFYGGEKHESDKQRNPQGIALYFSVIKWHWSQLIGLNLLFLVTCIPIVTIPTAMTAMSRVLGLMVRRRVCYPVHDYCTVFREDWKRATLAGGAAWLLVVIAAFGAYFYPRVYQGALGMGAAGILIIVVAVVLMMMVYLFPMITFTELSPAKLLKNSLTLVMIRLPQTALVMLVAMVVIVISWAGQLFTVWVIPLFGFSLIGLTGVYVGWNGLKRYVITDDGESNASS